MKLPSKFTTTSTFNVDTFIQRELKVIQNMYKYGASHFLKLQKKLQLFKS